MHGKSLACKHFVTVSVLLSSGQRSLAVCVCVLDRQTSSRVCLVNTAVFSLHTLHVSHQ